MLTAMDSLLENFKDIVRRAQHLLLANEATSTGRDWRDDYKQLVNTLHDALEESAPSASSTPKAGPEFTRNKSKGLECLRRRIGKKKIQHVSVDKPIVEGCYYALKRYRDTDGRFFYDQNHLYEYFKKEFLEEHSPWDSQSQKQVDLAALDKSSHKRNRMTAVYKWMESIDAFEKVQSQSFRQLWDTLPHADETN